MAAKGDIVTVTGILYPVYDGDYENISGVVLSGNDENEYLVISNRHMDDLVSLCQEEVSLRGRVDEQNGMKTIEVRDYRIVTHYYDDYAGDMDDEYPAYFD